jgi:hypothetical protein
MVYAFVTGMFLGLPLGCYLREVGVANKIRTAYEVFVPAPTADKMDKYRNKSQDFFKNLKKGQADVKDFERYIYGGTRNERSQDAIDIAEKEIEKTMKEYKKI